MNYCENCRTVGEQETCANCGNRKLRPAEPKDACFLGELEARSAQMTAEILQKENIPCASVPSGDGIRSVFGLPLENCKLYVPYACLERANDILDAFADDFDEERRRELLDHFEQWHALPRSEKKMRKRLRLTDTQLFARCREIVERARRVDDGGRIGGCPKDGRYWFVYTDREILAFNCATYEVLSVTVRKK